MAAKSMTDTQYKAIKATVEYLEVAVRDLRTFITEREHSIVVGLLVHGKATNIRYSKKETKMASPLINRVMSSKSDKATIELEDAITAYFNC